MYAYHHSKPYYCDKNNKKNAYAYCAKHNDGKGCYLSVESFLPSMLKRRQRCCSKCFNAMRKPRYSKIINKDSEIKPQFREVQRYPDEIITVFRSMCSSELAKLHMTAPPPPSSSPQQETATMSKKRRAQMTIHDVSRIMEEQHGDRSIASLRINRANMMRPLSLDNYLVLERSESYRRDQEFRDRFNMEMELAKRCGTVENGNEEEETRVVIASAASIQVPVQKRKKQPVPTATRTQRKWQFMMNVIANTKVIVEK